MLVMKGVASRPGASATQEMTVVDDVLPDRILDDRRVA